MRRSDNQWRYAAMVALIDRTYGPVGDRRTRLRPLLTDAAGNVVRPR
jgi:hypothetical protein